MGGVFVFLLLLVGLMQTSGRVLAIIDRWLPEAPASASPLAIGAAMGAAGGSRAAAFPRAMEEQEVAVALAIARAAWRADVAGRMAGKK
jgi:Na+-transporting methylmalonyl-CoA/oxaloacetate decarboxylase gamma subunit